MKPEITGEKIIARNRFLYLREISFTDDKNRQRTWESADRIGNQGAVVIVAETIPDNEIILIRQFRPPTGKSIIEFPAGLIDAGETAADAAERELYEETGYHGKIKEVTSAGYSSPGMSGEPIYIAFMEIDADAYRNCEVTAHPEETESIECFKIKRSELKSFLASENARGNGIDTKLYLYCHNC